MSPTPGLLYVTMQPQDSLPDAQFQDWYNNEHGPLRVRLPFCTNGFRYRATDLPSSGPSDSMPEWLAAYDITDMSEMTKQTYLALRTDTIKTPREKATMSRIKVDRRLYDLVSESSTASFTPIDSLLPPAAATILVARSITLRPDLPDAETRFDAWYTQEHLPLLQKVPGWQRTRRFKTSSVLAGSEPLEFLALHEYLPSNGLAGPEFAAAIATPWRNTVMAEVVAAQARRTYALSYTFGPAPRELGALHAGATAAWRSIDGRTSTHPAAEAADGIPRIQSYVTTADGVVLPYELSGSGDANAPLIILVNSILVAHGIWDGFLAAFFAAPAGKRYRVVRYNSRGRSADFGAKDVTMDGLAADAIAVLDALRVVRAAAVIGVSVGGATALNVALSYPSRVGSFIACDFNGNSSPGNVKAWEERIALAELDTSNPASAFWDREVGEKLAEATVRRWFVPGSYDNGATEKEVRRVKEMVRGNSLEGFRGSVRALYEYDLREKMKTSTVPGLLVVGAGDGALPKAMEGMTKGFEKSKVECVILDGAGHLPMVEKPVEFSSVVEKFLGGL